MSASASRRLFLVRHALTQPDEVRRSDHSRTLSTKGVRDSVELGFEMTGHGFTPDLVIGSDATRTWQTWQHMIGAFGRPVDARFTNYLYLCSGADMRALLRRLPDTLTSVMLLAHNPGLEALVELVSGENVSLEPGELVALEFSGSWKDLDSLRLAIVEILRR